MVFKVNLSDARVYLLLVLTTLRGVFINMCLQQLKAPIWNIESVGRTASCEPLTRDLSDGFVGL